jgi:hypothetical protein
MTTASALNPPAADFSSDPDVVAMIKNLHRREEPRSRR